MQPSALQFLLRPSATDLDPGSAPGSSRPSAQSPGPLPLQDAAIPAMLSGARGSNDRPPFPSEVRMRSSPGATPLRVLLVDDQWLVRQGLVSLLERHPGSRWWLD